MWKSKNANFRTELCSSSGDYNIGGREGKRVRVRWRGGEDWSIGDGWVRIKGDEGGNRERETVESERFEKRLYGRPFRMPPVTSWLSYNSLTSSDLWMNRLICLPKPFSHWKLLPFCFLVKMSTTIHPWYLAAYKFLIFSSPQCHPISPLY